MQNESWLAGHLAAIVNSSNDAIVSKTLDGIVTSWNPAAEDVFGYSAAEMLGQPIDRIIPADLIAQERVILGRIAQNEHIPNFETIRVHKDGRLIDISLTVSPVKDAGGTTIGASKIARDISTQRQNQQKQDMLLNEMSHRVKNLFALTTGLISLCDQSAGSAAELRDRLVQRLSALAKAHDLLLPVKSSSGIWGREADFTAVVEKILEPYVDNGNRVSIEGPTLAIGAHAVTDMALLLQEFATNAMKYGAFTQADGTVAVSWRVEDGSFNLIWRELGGPPVTGKPDHKGFGTIMTDGTATGRLGGKLEREWRPEGLTALLVVPLKRLTALQ
jgi:PAS domain S-box-containing protein